MPALFFPGEVFRAESLIKLIAHLLIVPLVGDGMNAASRALGSLILGLYALGMMSCSDAEKGQPKPRKPYEVMLSHGEQDGVREGMAIIDNDGNGLVDEVLGGRCGALGGPPIEPDFYMFVRGKNLTYRNHRICSGETVIELHSEDDKRLEIFQRRLDENRYQPYSPTGNSGANKR